MPDHGFRAFDVVYGAHAEQSLLARLYLPARPPPFPAVVDVHGGGWTSGDRFNNKAIDETLAAAGIAVMAIDFRMPPKDIYPASVADVHLAIRWLKQSGPAFGIAPNLIGGLGTSSGGHQLLLAVLRPFDPRYAAIPLAPSGTVGSDADATVPYVVACWPVADPLARYRMVKEKANQQLLAAHHAYWPDEAAMAEGNPQLIVEQGEHAPLPTALVIQGTDDNNLPPDSADRFVAAYRKRGGNIQLEKFAGQPHTFISRDPTLAASRSALTMIVEFIRQQTGEAPQASRAAAARS